MQHNEKRSAERRFFYGTSVGWATKKTVPNGTACDAGWQIKIYNPPFLRLPVAPSKLYGGEVAVGVVGVGFGHSCLLFFTEAAAILSSLGYTHL